MSATGEFRVQPPSYRSYYSDEEDSQGQITPATVSPPPSYHSSYSDEEDSQGQRTPATLTPTPSYRSTISEEQVRQGQRTLVKPPPSYRSAISDEKDSQGQRTPDPATPITKGLHYKAGRKNNCIVTANSAQILENIPALFIYWLGSTIAPTLTIRDVLLHPQSNGTDVEDFSFIPAGLGRCAFNYMWIFVILIWLLDRCTSNGECGAFMGCVVYSFVCPFTVIANFLFGNNDKARWILTGVDITLNFALAVFLVALLKGQCRGKH